MRSSDLLSQRERWLSKIQSLLDIPHRRDHLGALSPGRPHKRRRDTAG